MLFGAVTSVFAALSILRVENIEIVGSDTITPSDFLAAAQIKKGDLFFRFSSKKSAEKLCRAYPALREVRIKKVLPNTLRVTVTEDTALFTLVFDGTSYLLSSDLRVMGTGDGSGTIRLELPVASLAIGEKIGFADEAEGERMKTLISECAASSVGQAAVTFAFADRFDLQIITGAGVAIKLGNADTVSRKLEVAEKILSRDDAADIRVIDVGNPEEAVVQR